MLLAECNYGIHDKEMLAIIFTDHQALEPGKDNIGADALTCQNNKVSDQDQVKEDYRLDLTNKIIKANLTAESLAPLQKQAKEGNAHFTLDDDILLYHG
ncbi:hypothetical protein LAWI1_G005265 [Lachnellula willkommii]|uniref:Uncharacterized protein n=1 Tax=Lachnellula willkommii TaxID=215461 RepID=A0A559M868_9HELO|nr:hypothetical protein LAWI1_G005265 [Lachnellula willkommii]